MAPIEAFDRGQCGLPAVPLLGSHSVEHRANPPRCLRCGAHHPTSTPCREGASADSLRKGELVAGRFRVLDALGVGATGTVYRARQEPVDRLVALKLLLGSAFASQQAIARFLREAQVISRLTSVRTVTLYDFGQTANGGFYIAMEYLAGGTLGARLARGPLEREAALRIVDEICEGLVEAHEAGILHRDIKPDNILFERPDDDTAGVRLADFGIAGRVDAPRDLTTTGAILGTPAYLPPEYGLSLPVDERGDLYSLGCVLYQMLSGRLPFDADSITGLLYQHAHVAPSAFAALDPPVTVDPDLEILVLQMMAKSPDARPASARAVRARLAALRVEGASEVPPPSSSEALQAPSQRLRPWVWRVMLAAMAVVGVWLGVRWGEHQPSEPARPSAAVGSTSLSVPEILRAQTTRPRLLVLPFAHDTERMADKRLWPLVDTMIINALRPDDVLRQRLERIDPRRVREEIVLRELSTPLTPAGALELAVGLRADVVLEGRVMRRTGQIVLEANLHLPTTPHGVILRASGAQILDAVSTFVAEMRRQVWPGDPSPPSPETRAQLWLSRASTATALAAVGREMPARQRLARYDALMQADPESVGVAWLSFVEHPRSEKRRETLRQHAATVDDPALREFLLALATPTDSACEGLDIDALARRYPSMIGPLGDAMCSLARGDLARAVERALDAHRDLTLRPLTYSLLSKHLHFARALDQEIPLRRQLLALSPERAHGWSKLALWYASTGDGDEAHALLRVARSLTATDRWTNYMVGYHGAQAQLLTLDVEGAREWFELMDQNRPSKGPSSSATLLRALFLMMQGRFGDARQLTARGLAAAPPGDAYTMLATSLFYMHLTDGQHDAAARVVDELGALFNDPDDASNLYGVAMLRLGLKRARGQISAAEAAVHAQKLGDRVVALRHREGEVERTAHECLHHTHFGPAETCRETLFRDPDSKLTGGCRYRYAQLLEAQGKLAEAIHQYTLALEYTVWLRFGYVDAIAGMMLGLAGAQQKSGDTVRAMETYRRITVNYAHADREIPEVITARQALLAPDRPDLAQPIRE